MKLFIFLSLTCLVAACSNSKHASGYSSKLNGTWLPVKEEIAGKPIPAAGFQTQKLVVNDTNYTFTAESVDKGSIRYKDGKMDIYGRDGVNAGKHFTAIYKLEDGQLSICYNLAGANYPEAYDTKGHPLYFLCQFKKQ